jgi:hypothetical protein
MNSKKRSDERGTSTRLESSRIFKLRGLRNRYLQAAENCRRLAEEIGQGSGENEDVAALLLGRARRSEFMALEDYVCAMTAYKDVLLKALGTSG